MAYIHTAHSSSGHFLGFDVSHQKTLPVVQRTFTLTDADRDTVLDFLNERPVHTVAMSSFIYDNGMESPLNRGKFYGYRNALGNLEGVALIGHTTLVEARSADALNALSITARKHSHEIHLIMSSDDLAMDFWANAIDTMSTPRLVCREKLFEVGFPFPVQNCNHTVRLATANELLQVAEAQAEVAFIETGSDPMLRDREGFLKRVLRRIEQDRVYVVMDGDKLVFKADVVSLTEETAYLEGVYVSEERRGNGVGPSCLAEVTRRLLGTVRNVCLLSNVDFTGAHKSFQKAGFRTAGECTTVFV